MGPPPALLSRAGFDTAFGGGSGSTSGSATGGMCGGPAPLTTRPSFESLNPDADMDAFLDMVPYSDEEEQEGDEA